MSHYMPTKKAIKKHWENWLVENGKFDSLEDLWERDYCFACGMINDAGVKEQDKENFKATERCHIKARVKGGADAVENIHLLCPICHKASEYMEGEEYFHWLKNRDGMHMILETVAKLNPSAYLKFIQSSMKVAGIK